MLSGCYFVGCLLDEIGCLLCVIGARLVLVGLWGCFSDFGLFDCCG